MCHILKNDEISKVRGQNDNNIEVVLYVKVELEIKVENSWWLK